MAKSTYRVVGDATLAVDGNEYVKGDEFKSDMTDEQAQALVEGGHIKAVNTASTSSTQKEN